MMVILSQIFSFANILLRCVFSPPPPPRVVLFPTLSSAFPVHSGIAPTSKHYIIKVLTFRMHK